MACDQQSTDEYSNGEDLFSPDESGPAYVLSLTRWLRDSDIHHNEPRIFLQTWSENETTGIELSADEARELAKWLIEGARRLDEGWR